MNKYLLIFIIGMLLIGGFYLFTYIKNHGFFEFMVWIFIGLSTLFFGGLGYAVVTYKEN